MSSHAKAISNETFLRYAPKYWSQYLMRVIMAAKKPSKSLLELNFLDAKLQSLFIKFFSPPLSDFSFNTKLMKHLTCFFFMLAVGSIWIEIVALDFSCFGSGMMSDLNFQFYYTFQVPSKWKKVGIKVLKEFEDILGSLLLDNKNHFVNPE